MSNIALVRPAGQALKINGRPEGSIVRVNGSQVNAAADGSFPLTAGAPSSVEIVQGDAVLMRANVPALAATGIAGVAVVRAVMDAADPRQVVADILTGFRTAQ